MCLNNWSWYVFLNMCWIPIGIQMKPSVGTTAPPNSSILSEAKEISEGGRGADWQPIWAPDQLIRSYNQPAQLPQHIALTSLQAKLEPPLLGICLGCWLPAAHCERCASQWSGSWEAHIWTAALMTTQQRRSRLAKEDCLLQASCLVVHSLRYRRILSHPGTAGNDWQPL